MEKKLKIQIFKNFFLVFFESRNHDLRKFVKIFFLIFFPAKLILKAIPTGKKRVFLTFLKRGSLEFAHIRSTCGPDLPRARHALRFDVQFRQGLPRKKVRCAGAHGPRPHPLLSPPLPFPVLLPLDYYKLSSEPLSDSSSWPPLYRNAEWNSEFHLLCIY